MFSSEHTANAPVRKVPFFGRTLCQREHPSPQRTITRRGVAANVPHLFDLIVKSWAVECSDWRHLVTKNTKRHYSPHPTANRLFTIVRMQGRAAARRNAVTRGTHYKATATFRFEAPLNRRSLTKDLS